MNTYLNRLAILVGIVGLTNPLFALAAPVKNPFSPYTDLTINTYWDPQYQDMEPMDLVAVSKTSGIQSYHLAFITDAGSCSPAWGGESSYSVSTSWGSHLTDKLQKNHIPYTVSFGGASGADLSQACTVPQLVNAYEQIIKTYQPQGLDFDIENGTAVLATMMPALQQIQKAHPNLKISFTLPTLPTGLVDSGIVVVRQAQAAGLQYSVNIMAMDYGPVFANDMGQYAIQAAQNLFNFLKTLYPTQSDATLWGMIQVTPMIGVNDVQPEQFTLANVDTIRNFANQNGLGGLSMWSVARDNPCPDKWASPICSGANLQSKSYEFSQRFMIPPNK